MRRLASCSPSPPRAPISASISSMKMVLGAWCLGVELLEGERRRYNRLWHAYGMKALMEEVWTPCSADVSSVGRQTETTYSFWALSENCCARSACTARRKAAAKAPEGV